jgi:UDP-N-acetylglucosamine acyltransferase
MGDRARLHGLNIVGLKRQGFARSEIQAMNEAFRMLFASDDTLAERIDRVAAAFGDAAGIRDIVAFVRAESSRALCRPPRGHGD